MATNIHSFILLPISNCAPGSTALLSRCPINSGTTGQPRTHISRHRYFWELSYVLDIDISRGHGDKVRPRVWRPICCIFRRVSNKSIASFVNESQYCGIHGVYFSITMADVFLGSRHYYHIMSYHTIIIYHPRILPYHVISYYHYISPPNRQMLDVWNDW